MDKPLPDPSVTSIEPLPLHSPERNAIFFGLNGLRAGWGAAMYIAIAALY